MSKLKITIKFYLLTKRKNPLSPCLSTLIAASVISLKVGKSKWYFLFRYSYGMCPLANIPLKVDDMHILHEYCARYIVCICSFHIIIVLSVHFISLYETKYMLHLSSCYKKQMR